MRREASGPRLLLAGCCSLAALSCARREAVIPSPGPVAATYGELRPGREPGQEAAESEPAERFDAASFPAGFGVRAGTVACPGTIDYEVEPRGSLGVYYHFMGSSRQRLEGGADLARDRVHPADNYYLALRFDYVKYVGETGFLYWSAGGGLRLEKLYADNPRSGFADAGIGYCLGLGFRRELDLRLGLQLPVGRGLNASLLVYLIAGYDF